ncbi:MAG: hypothetical protein II897_04110 [Clostridia bacterium]|nr:hypothetical protein [Clostridia bacterium]
MEHSMTLTAKEKNTVFAVFHDLIMNHTSDELHKFIGSVTIMDMMVLHSKIRFDDYCKNHGIAFEDMTDDDYVKAYLEENEC